MTDVFAAELALISFSI